MMSDDAASGLSVEGGERPALLRGSGWGHVCVIPAFRHSGGAVSAAWRPSPSFVLSLQAMSGLLMLVCVYKCPL
jgi:hypothetical protein